MKDYKPTLKLVKNKWYVSMTVPFELRYILTNQIRLSTSTSDKNEATKQLPELAIQLKNKISNAVEQLRIDLLKEKVFSIADKLLAAFSLYLNQQAVLGDIAPNLDPVPAEQRVYRNI